MRLFSGIKSIAPCYTANKSLFWTCLLFAIWYCCIALVNHYCFRTYSLDLGLYTNALYDYSHFQFNDSLTFNVTTENLLADHFDLYLVLFSPLSYLFGTYTLQIVQIASIIFGAIGINRLMKLWFPNSKIPLSATLVFLLFFGNFSALAFDYHSNVVAAMLIPWLFLTFENKKVKSAWMVFVFIIIAKENMSFWLFFVTTGLAWIHRKDKQLVRTSLLMALISILYFVLVLGFIMPWFSNAGSYHHFHYTILGNSASEAFIHLITHPLEAIKWLFYNHSGDVVNNYVKAELWIFLLLSGFLAIKKPIYLWMLLPIFGQKMYHDDPKLWGIHWQYAIEFGGILTIASFDVIRTMKKQKLKNFFVILLPILSFAASFRLMDNTIAYVEKARVRVYKSAHYSREFSISEAYKVLKKIPKNVAVSAQSAFVPHLALRDTVYTFPIIGEAKYILISPVESTYPLTTEEFQQKTNDLKQSNIWNIHYKSEEFILLKRKE